MIKQRIAFNFSKVTFDLDIPLKGTLFLMAYGEEYRFEFIPQNPNLITPEENPSKNLRMVFELTEVKEIKQIQDTCSSSIGFILTDNTILPEFIFQFNQNGPKHLIEFLLFKKYAISSTDKNVIFITLKGGNTSSKSKKKTEKYCLDPRMVVDYVSHQKIINDFSENSMIDKELITCEMLKSCFNSNGTCDMFSYIKEMIFTKGLDDDARLFIWPYLLNVYDYKLTYKENDKAFCKKVIEYRIYKKQWESMVDSQKNEVQTIRSFLSVIENDVKRTDRVLPQYRDLDSPYLLLLKHVLLSYGVYNRDSGYVQGMGDLISPIIVLFIHEFKENELVELKDGKIMTVVEAEAFFFWILDGIMCLLHHDRMFTEIVKNQIFQMERIVAIIAAVHSPLQRWLIKSNNNNLLFMYGSYLLLFKRDFEGDISKTLRIWDSFFAAENPVVFPRVFLASILILLYPKFLFNTDGTIGEVMDVTKATFPKLDIFEILNISAQIQEKVLNEEGGLLNWVLLDLPTKTEYLDYVSKYFPKF
ncbi:TBC domain containing protein [Tritrichomonas foetus]|uniref:TBC domain containing protein n=1 Tax=Tritrichomonas foetus TaxID=1144522 RepID=A0A1J4KLQ1_9EUKA|nr:TBC domain containing protein [Tritrichomonas foetus]|eukprot:OHT12066.1 TBC domain containing protein [Tritrichomonas foetus]